MKLLLGFAFFATAYAQSPFTEAVTVEKVAGGFQFTEGPCWVPPGILLFSDVSADTVYRWTPKSQRPSSAQPMKEAHTRAASAAPIPSDQTKDSTANTPWSDPLC